MPELIPAVPLSAEWHAARRGGVTATDIVTGPYSCCPGCGFRPEEHGRPILEASNA